MTAIVESTPDNSNAFAATLELNALLGIAHENRQAAWEHRLMHCLPRAIFTSGEPEIIFNPIGLTYYNLELPDTDLTEDPETKNYNIPELIDTFLINEGIGIAIEARDPKRVIDLSYGDVLGFYLNRHFAEPETHYFKTDKPRASLIREGAELVVSDVPPEVLPQGALNLLQDILKHLGMENPVIKLLYLPETEQYELVFAIDSNQLSQAQSQTLIKKIGWFLPRYYSFMACDLKSINLDTQA